eukprot:NODE_26_length_40862_cov_0.679513.p14 type:complete len:338 gc:universal NODE_26_length_40862_cov_0.679513:12613-11600(-)
MSEQRSNSPAPSTSTDTTAYMFTCGICGIAFSVGDQQRRHHGSDWHRYNLKLKMNGLPSVSAQEFQIKVEQKKVDASPLSDLVYTCKPCNKQYVTENGYITHTQSKKHIENARGKEHEVDIQEKKKRVIRVATDEEKLSKNVLIEECLFCPESFEKIEDAIDHMVTTHEFFFPDIEYLVDIKGLLLYLGHKVKIGFGCVWCHQLDQPEKGLFRSVVDCQKHMVDLGHCKIKFEDEHWNEYAAFYDFTSMEDPTLVTLDPNTNELILNGEKKLGHRSWHKYYKQHYSNIEDNKARDVAKQNPPQQVPKRDLRKRSRNDWRLKLGVKANSQKHFREQIL